MFGLPWWLSSKESAGNGGATGDMGSMPELGRFPGGGNGSTLQYSFFFFKFYYYYYYFYFTILYWFCHTSTCIHHRCTRVPHPEPPFHLPPHTIPLGHPSVPAPSFLYPASNLDWRSISYMTLYMF